MLLSFAILTAGALVFLAAAIQHLNTVTANGIAFAFTDRSTPLSREGFAGRAARTLQNNLESAAMFTPPAILLLVTGTETPLATAAAGTYIATRIDFTLAYWTAQNRLLGPRHGRHRGDDNPRGANTPDMICQQAHIKKHPEPGPI